MKSSCPKVTDLISLFLCPDKSFLRPGGGYSGFIPPAARLIAGREAELRGIGQPGAGPRCHGHLRLSLTIAKSTGPRKGQGEGEGERGAEGLQPPLHSPFAGHPGRFGRTRTCGENRAKRKSKSAKALQLRLEL